MVLSHLSISEFWILSHFETLERILSWCGCRISTLESTSPPRPFKGKPIEFISSLSKLSIHHYMEVDQHWKQPWTAQLQVVWSATFLLVIYWSCCVHSFLNLFLLDGGINHNSNSFITNTLKKPLVSSLLLAQLTLKCTDGVSAPPCELYGGSALHPKNGFVTDIFRVTLSAYNLIWSKWNKHIHGNLAQLIPKGANWFLVEVEWGTVVEQDGTPRGESVWSFSLSVYWRNFDTPTSAVRGNNTA